MVKVKGRNVKLTPSDYVTKDLTSIQRKKKVNKKTAAAAQAARLAEEAQRLKAESEIQLPETRQSDEPKSSKVCKNTARYRWNSHKFKPRNQSNLPKCESVIWNNVSYRKAGETSNGC